MKKINFLFFICSILISAGCSIDSSEPSATTIQHRIDSEKSNKLYYTSTDASGNKTELSASIVYPESGKIRYAILNCHGTIFKNSESPSELSEKSQLLYFINQNSNITTTDKKVLEDALIVEADYLGFGATKNLPHPYLSAELCGKNCVEALLAAIQYMKEQGRAFSDDFFTVITGYSQGGQVALASQKYTENMNSADQNVIKLKKVYCGAGPYNPAAMISGFFTDIENNTDEKMVPYVILLIQGMYISYTSEFNSKEIYSIYDFFSFSESENDPVKILNSKDYYLSNDGIYAKPTQDLAMKNLLSSEFKAETGNKFYDTLKASLEKNDLSKNWSPQHDLQLYHNKSDEMINISFTTNLKDAFSGKEHFLSPVISETSSYTPITSIHTGYCIMEYVPALLADITTLK